MHTGSIELITIMTIAVLATSCRMDHICHQWLLFQLPAGVVGMPQLEGHCRQRFRQSGGYLKDKGYAQCVHCVNWIVPTWIVPTTVLLLVEKYTNSLRHTELCQGEQKGSCYLPHIMSRDQGFSRCKCLSYFQDQELVNMIIIISSINKIISEIIKTMQ